MRKLFATVICLLAITGAWAADAAYLQAMKKNLEALKKAQTREELQAVAHAFERISARATQEWLPLYYTAYTYIKLSQKEEGLARKDAVLDQARPFVDKLLALAPRESEAVLMDGYWTMIRLSNDPAGRGQSLSMPAMQLFEQAAQMDPQNPRAFLMKAQMEYGTAQFFGSSTEPACAMFRKSLALFEKVKPKDEISPSWGKEMAQYMAEKCP